MKHLDDPNFPWFEHQYLKFLHKCLTTDWALLQFGADGETLELWWLILKVL